MAARIEPRLDTNAAWLGAANAVALIAAGIAALAYARWLDARAFSVWAGALALARALLIVLDGGLKTALVRRGLEPGAATLARLRRGSAGVALGLVALLAAGAVLAAARGIASPAEAFWFGAYGAAYLLPYPPLFGALARLERAQSFRPVARAEAGSAALEFALPAALLAAGVPAWAAFTAAVALARGWRSVGIVAAARDLPPAGPEAADAALPAGVLREGLGVQAVALISMLRDHLHLLLVAPLFGPEWAGRYAFAFTACALLSQVFVQTAARVGLPALRAAAPAERWPATLRQLRALAAVALPPLALLPAALAWADGALWSGRWAEAIALLPWLAWRMLPSVATTPLGALLLVEVSPWDAARAHAAWTVVEAGVAALLLAWLGPRGLAVATALTAWAGVAIFAARVQPGRPWRAWAPALLRALLAQRAGWFALALGAVLWQMAKAS